MAKCFSQAKPLREKFPKWEFMNKKYTQDVTKKHCPNCFYQGHKQYLVIGYKEVWINMGDHEIKREERIERNVCPNCGSDDNFSLPKLDIKALMSEEDQDEC